MLFLSTYDRYFDAFAHYRTIAMVWLCRTGHYHYLMIMPPDASQRLWPWRLLAFYHPANYL